MANEIATVVKQPPPKKIQEFERCAQFKNNKLETKLCLFMCFGAHTKV